jgi:uncharacterized protein (DUF169 family)
MMDKQDMSDQLTDKLKLERPPIAIAFVQEKPDGVKAFEGQVPSACTFWPQAEHETFYATAEQHFNCPVGAMTMGFELPDSVRDGLMGLVQRMCADDYLSESEPGSIPTVGTEKGGIVYGPLADFPVEPDAVLMWLSPEQAMLYNEAAGSATWSAEMASNVFGRPTCAALPAAINQSRPTMSLGCIGMRTFTGAPADAMVGAVPASKTEEFVRALDRAAASNKVMQEFYEDRKAQFV